MQLQKILKLTVPATTTTHAPHCQIKLNSMLLPQHENYKLGAGYIDASSCNSYLKQVIPNLNFEILLVAES